MSVRPANPLFATLVVALTLLLCALLPKALRDATVLLQYRSARFQESSFKMNSSRQMGDMEPYILNTTATCSLPIQMADCKEMAQRLSVGSYFRTLIRYKTVDHTMGQNKYPSGCIVDGNWVMFNKNPSTKDCGQGTACLCMRPVRHPELIETGTCDSIVTKDECKAKALQENFPFKVAALPKVWIRGCFKFTNRFGATSFWYNTEPTATGACRKNRLCYCYTKQPEAPPAPEVTGYISNCAACPPSNIFASKSDCYATAQALGVYQSSWEYMNDDQFPAGCFKIKNKLWYNQNTASRASCDQSDYTCICSGSKPASTAYTKTSNTCPKALSMCECKEKADELDLNYDNREFMNLDTYPAGCFMINRVLWHNTKKSSTVQCGTKNTTCICD